jgi:hypothetical protein
MLEKICRKKLRIGASQLFSEEAKWAYITISYPDTTTNLVAGKGNE